MEQHHPGNAESFEREGVLERRSVIDKGAITALRHRLWELVERSFAIRENDPSTWYGNQEPVHGQYQGYRLSGMNHIMEELRADGLCSPVLAAIEREVEEAFGANRWEPLEKWYSLLTFPSSQGDWNVPHNRWHSDEPIVVGDPQPWSLFAFVFLDTVDRDTGPTVAVTGSHRRGEPLAERHGISDGRQIRAFSRVNEQLIDDPDSAKMLPVGGLFDGLASTDEWFAALSDDGPLDQRIRTLIDEGTTTNGISSRVVELTGQPGDAILFDPRCLHSSSRNVSSRPRQVLRVDLRRLPR